jgi:hypothetical protein
MVTIVDYIGTFFLVSAFIVGFVFIILAISSIYFEKLEKHDNFIIATGIYSLCSFLIALICMVTYYHMNKEDKNLDELNKQVMSYEKYEGDGQPTTKVWTFKNGEKYTVIGD